MGLTLKLVCVPSMGDNGEAEYFRAVVRITLQTGISTRYDIQLILHDFVNAHIIFAVRK